jgi:HD-like signal output (HDOD) protein
MLHDLGLLVLDKYCPDELDECITYSKEQKVPLQEAELVLLGCDHSEIGGLLAEKWAIQDTMQGAINHQALDQHGEHFPEACIIAGADAIARQCGYDSLPMEISPEIPRRAQAYLNVGEEQLEVIRSVVHHEVQQAGVACAA